MAEATAPSPAGQSPHTGALNLTDITRERIDIGLIAAGDDLGVHISQEESLENPVESQPETQTQDSTATTTAPVTASRNKFSYSKRKLTGSRDLFLKDAYKGFFQDPLVEVVGKITECPRKLNNNRYRIDWRRNNGNPLPEGLQVEYLREYYENNEEVKTLLRQAIEKSDTFLFLRCH